jgi:hypothetical protein
MKTLRVISTLAVLAVLIAGCGGESGGPTEPPPGGTAEAEPNDFNAQLLGALSTTDFVISGSTATGADVDLFSVTAAEPVTLLASLDWSGGSDLELTISNSNGIFVRHVDTAGHPEACTIGGLPAGTYTVRVGTLSNAAQSYSLRIGKR